jgi:hypothetical protein
MKAQLRNGVNQSADTVSERAGERVGVSGEIARPSPSAHQHLAKTHGRGRITVDRLPIYLKLADIFEHEKRTNRIANCRLYPGIYVRFLSGLKRDPVGEAALISVSQGGPAPIAFSECPRTNCFAELAVPRRAKEEAGEVSIEQG